MDCEAQTDDYVESDDDVANIMVDYCYRVSEVPKTYQQAISCEESQGWQHAMESEMNSLEENGTYSLVPLPKGRKAIGSRWVYTVKLGTDGEEQLKARCVAKGFSQIADIDYHETFSPTARLTSIRMFMQIAVEQSMVVHQMDFNCAYLNADIDAEIYMKQPEGFKKDPGLVCKLNKSLYGLKQSGRLWNGMLDKFLKEQNFVNSLADTCVYTKSDGKSKLILLVWVDDLIIAANDMQVLKLFKLSLTQNFKMKDLGIISHFLGIEFTVQNDFISMKQPRYIEKDLDKYKMSDCNPKSIPCNPGINKELSHDSKILNDVRLYRGMVGSLIYVMTATRPDLCYVVNLLSQHMASPTKAHLNLCKQVLKYLKGTKFYELKYCKSDGGPKLTGFCDSDWGASSNRRSTSGYCYFLNRNGPLISWRSKKQREVVALSSCEAEYIALTDAMKEANFLRQLLADMTGEERKIVDLYADNQGAISLSKNPVHHKRTKHIDIRYHFIRLEVQSGIVNIMYVPSASNIADMFTKPLPKPKLTQFECIRGGKTGEGG